MKSCARCGGVGTASVACPDCLLVFLAERKIARIYDPYDWYDHYHYWSIVKLAYPSIRTPPFPDPQDT